MTRQWVWQFALYKTGPALLCLFFSPTRLLFGFSYTKRDYGYWGEFSVSLGMFRLGLSWQQGG